MQPAKHCRVEVENDTVILMPMSSLGELDCDLLASDMDGVLSLLQQQRARHLVIDFRHTEYFCSEFIYLLIKLHRRVKEQRGRMALCGMSAHRREVLSLMALDKLWPLCASQVEALDFVRRHTLDILVVDDSEIDRCLVGGLLSGNPDYHVAYANSGAAALAHMRHSLPDVVISDLVMPELNGLELIGQVRQSYPLVPVILLTASATSRSRSRPWSRARRVTYRRPGRPSAWRIQSIASPPASKPIAPASVCRNAPPNWHARFTWEMTQPSFGRRST